MNKYVGLLSLALLAACGAPKQNTAFYTFDTAAPRTVANRKISVDVGRVRIPEYLDRPQMVTTSGVSVDIDQHNRWAENPGTLIQRRLISNLASSLPASTVKDANFISTPGDYAVFVEVYRLDGAIPGAPQISAMYSITGDNSAPHVRRVAYTGAAASDYAEYAASLGALIDRLSDDIARDLAKIK